MSEFCHKTGLLLVGHGTRNETGMKQFLALAERIGTRLRGEAGVQPAFLELQQPDIDAAVGRLVETGITRLVTLPLLLFAAGHAKEDVPKAVAAAVERRGRNEIGQVQAEHLGCHGAVVELSRLRAEEAVRGFRVQGSGFSKKDSGDRGQGTGDTESCLLLVGRGSHDGSATAEMYEFARLRSGNLDVESLTYASGLYDQARQEPRPAEKEFRSSKTTPLPPVKVEVAFLAMARPLLSEQLPVIARQDYRRVIVQPHLLFHGELVDSVARQVAAARDRFPQTEWITVQPLADLPGAASRGTELLEKVILDRCQEAGIHVVAMGADD